MEEVFEDGGFFCMDCKGPQDHYMVHNELWHAAWPEYRRYKRALLARYPDHKSKAFTKTLLALCVPCLEKRIGRRLRSTDLTDWPINALFRRCLVEIEELRGRIHG